MKPKRDCVYFESTFDWHIKTRNNYLETNDSVKKKYQPRLMHSTLRFFLLQGVGLQLNSLFQRWQGKWGPIKVASNVPAAASEFEHYHEENFCNWYCLLQLIFSVNKSAIRLLYHQSQVHVLIEKITDIICDIWVWAIRLFLEAPHQ